MKRITAALLALFLGGLGVHRFYVGNPGVAIIYLVFSWTLIPVFVALLDAVIWLSWSDEKFLLKYRKDRKQNDGELQHSISL